MKRLLVALGIVVVLATSLAARQAWLENRQLAEGLIQANGRTEGDHVAVSSKFAGRVAELLVREGDAVRSKQPLARLDDSQILAQLNQAKHGVTVAAAIVRGAEADVAAAAADVQAAKTSLELLKKQVPLAIKRRKRSCITIRHYWLRRTRTKVRNVVSGNVLGSCWKATLFRRRSRTKRSLHGRSRRTS